MLQRCPACQAGFENHQYALFAVTILGDDRKERLRDFFQAGDENRWADLQKFQDFDSKQDAVVAYAVKCPEDKTVFVMERSPSELYEVDRLIACKVLDAEQGADLEKTIPENEWRQLSGPGAT